MKFVPKHKYYYKIWLLGIVISAFGILLYYKILNFGINHNVIKAIGVIFAFLGLAIIAFNIKKNNT